MILNEQAVELAFKGFKTLYTDAYSAAPVFYDKVAMTVPSSARNEAYGWLGQFPQLREWLDGEREVKDLTAHGFTIENRKFESTIGIKREDFADDRLGIFKPMVWEMGHCARQHPDELIFAMLADGFTTECYDGQYFFDTDHPTKDAAGNVISVSNMADGAAQPWFLMDTTPPIKPIIWQEREKYEFTPVNNHNDDAVFMTDEYKMGITPSTLVVGPDLEEAAAKIVNSEVNDGGGSNPWKGTAELIVTPYLGG